MRGTYFGEARGAEVCPGDEEPLAVSYQPRGPQGVQQPSTVVFCRVYCRVFQTLCLAGAAKTHGVISAIDIMRKREIAFCCNQLSVVPDAV